MYSHSSGTTVLHLNLNSVNKLPIPKTNIGHQKKIAEKLKSIEENIKKYQRLKEFAKNIQNQIINKIFG
jgi:restriction endonuclease S subunit